MASRIEKEPVITVRDLTCGYGDEVIVRHVNFEVFPGEVFAILGGSGSGKSTVMMNMVGLYRAMSGSVLIQGREMIGADEATRMDILRRIGVMYQMGALFGSMTLLENVSLPLQEFTDLPAEAVEAVARVKLAQVGLGPYAAHMPSEISGGMAKRAAIARAMALDPAILFLDEPSAGLDPITSAELDELITELSTTLGMTFVMVSHELPSILSIAHRAIVLDKNAKTVVDQGDPREMKKHSTNPYVHQFFNRQARGDRQA